YKTLRQNSAVHRRGAVIVLTTMPADDRAAMVAQTLIGERLAACVNVHPPMRSVYRWHGAVQSDEERQVVIKTTRQRLGALTARIRQLHPYELPELLVIDASGSAEYVDWITSEVGRI